MRSLGAIVIIFVLSWPACSFAAPRVCLREACYIAEVVRTDAAREKGLMFRQGLAQGTAMLFEFEFEDIYPFWMKNMTFPIDILWLDKDRRVVHIAPNVPPCRTEVCPVISPSGKALSVLEIPAGDAARHGIMVGDTLTTPGAA